LAKCNLAKCNLAKCPTPHSTDYCKYISLTKEKTKPNNYKNNHWSNNNIINNKKDYKNSFCSSNINDESALWKWKL